MKRFLIKHRRGISACLVAALLFLLLLVLVPASPTLTQKLLQPVVEILASRAIRGTVNLERLEISKSGIRLIHLRGSRPEGLVFSVQNVSVDYSLRKLLARHVESVRVVRPLLRITTTVSAVEAEPPRVFSLPEEFPLTIGQVELSDGSVIVERKSDEFRIEGIGFLSNSGAPNRFELSLSPGGNAAERFHASGTFAWPGWPQVVIESARFGERSLLSEPLDLTWSTTGGPEGRGAIRIQHIDDQLVRDIAQALNRTSPLPQDLAFEFTNTRVRFDLQEEKDALHARIEEGRVCQDTRCLTLGNVDLTLRRQAGTTFWETSIFPDEAGEIRSSGIMENGVIQGDFHVSLPDMGSLLSTASMIDSAEISGGLHLEGKCRAERSGQIECRANVQGVPAVSQDSQALFYLEHLGVRIEVLRSLKSWSVQADLSLSGRPLGRIEGSLDDIRWALAPGSWEDLRLLLGSRAVPEAIVDMRGVQTSGRFRTGGDASWSAETAVKVEALETRQGTCEGIEFKTDINRGRNRQTVARASLGFAQFVGADIAFMGSLRGNAVCTSAGPERVHCEASVTGMPGGADTTVNRSVIFLEPVRTTLLADGTGATWKGQGTLSLDGKSLFQASLDSSRVTWNAGLDSLTDLERLVGADLLPFDSLLAQGIRASGTLDFSDAGSLQASIQTSVEKLEAEPFQLEAVSLVMDASRTRDGWAVPSLTLDTRLSGTGLPVGTLTLKGAGNLDEERMEIQLHSLQGSDLEYLSADGLSGFGGGFLYGEGRIELMRQSHVVNVVVSGKTGVGEVLAGKFYADMTPVSLNFTAQTRADIRNRVAELEAIRASLGDLGALELSGRVSAESVDTTARIEVPDLQQWTVVLGPSLQDLSPALASMKLGGTLDANLLFVRTAGSVEARGEIHPANVSLESDSLGLQMQGLRGSVPFFLSWMKEPGPGKPGKSRGQLHLSGLSVGPLRIASPEIDFAVQSNRVQLMSPLVFSIAGGQVVADTLAAGYGGDGVEIEGRLRVENVDLESLTQDLKIPLMKGRFAADLGTIRYAQNVLASDGKALVKAFGGELTVQNLYMEQPFSRFRTIHGDIDFSGIDLRQLSQTFEFGEMNGVVDGFVHELRLFDATPSRFIARVETREQGKRDISVKALNNLSIISQGGITAVLSRGMYRFIDFYRYRKIGIHCELENDVFTLTGTAREDSDRYLVDGSLVPPRIDIVAPGQKISFKEMLKRIKRVDRKRT